MIKNGTLPPDDGIITYADEEKDNEEDDEDEDGQSFDASTQEFQAQEYYKTLQPILYANKKDALNVTFKSFMSNNIRKHLPAGYNHLVKDWKAVERWRDPRYLLDKIGEEFIEAVGYMKQEPYVNYMGSIPEVMHQRGNYVRFGDFFQRYMEKFTDPNIKHPFDVVNMIW